MSVVVAVSFMSIVVAFSVVGLLVVDVLKFTTVCSSFCSCSMVSQLSDVGLEGNVIVDSKFSAIAEQPIFVDMNF